MRERVAIIGPYTGTGGAGSEILNVRRAIAVGDQVIKKGGAPYIPHLFHFHELVRPHSYRVWLEVIRPWLLVAERVVRLPGHSRGTDEEEEAVRSLGIPVTIIK